MKELQNVEVAIIIARNLKKARKKAGLTQGKVADLACIARTTYNAQERGKRVMSIQNLIKTAAVLNVTVDELAAGIFEAMQEN